MSTITEFLLARIAEDEEAARGATRGPWAYPPREGHYDDGVVVATSLSDRYDDREPRFVALTSYDGQSNTTMNSDADGEHIARHDPKRVLAECEARRRIVEYALELDADYPGVSGPSADLLPMLASVYADHEDFQDEWRTA